MRAVKMSRSDGRTASYYQLPPQATELQDLISFKDMNAQIGEIMRSCYRYGEASHSDRLRDIRKIIYYAKAEEERLLALELRQRPSGVGTRIGNDHTQSGIDDATPQDWDTLRAREVMARAYKPLEEGEE